MNATRMLCLTMSAALISGCGRGRDRAASDTTTAARVAHGGAAPPAAVAAPVTDTGGPTWTATLGPLASYHGKEKVHGTAEATSDSAGQSSRATVSIMGATSGSTHPWHVHRGTCGHDQGIVGDPSAYPPIKVDSTGNGTAAATVSQVLTSSGQYMVNVHESPSNQKTIVACGELKKPGT